MSNGPKVKLLNWIEEPYPHISDATTAYVPHGYYVHEEEEGWKYHYGESPVFSTRQEAKDAAQAHYQTCILSALEDAK